MLKYGSVLLTSLLFFRSFYAMMTNFPTFYATRSDLCDIRKSCFVYIINRMSVFFWGGGVNNKSVFSQIDWSQIARVGETEIVLK